MTADEGQVIGANQAFYAAFAGRDVAAMDAVWARGAEVTCLHPGWLPLVGREAVMASWRAILGGPHAPEIGCSHPRAFVRDDFAWVLCLERIGPGAAALVATNLFVREAGAWRIVHHQAGQLAMADDSDDGSEDPGSRPN
jgi:ketosteroid isomerase-like protein